MQRVPAELQTEIQQFLTHEAWLLDSGKLREWLALLTEDVRYRMPVRATVGSGMTGGADNEPVFCLFDDDKKSLEMRTMRIETGTAHAEIPQSVTQRLITNVMVNPSESAGEFVVLSSFIVYQERLGRHGSTFIGKRSDRLRPANGDWQIARRDIELAQTVLPSTISIFF
jgi:3-phenylpropionate/trans-cinnamate dioxygenase beta subunit